MPTVRRKVRNRKEAEHLLQEQAAGAHSLRTFCATHGIDARSLHCWKLNLTRARSPSPAGEGLRLIELVTPNATAPRRRYLLHIDDVTIEVDDDFDDDRVARLLALARTC